MASVDLKNLVKRYDGNTEDTVKGVDLAVKDQEFVVLVGPSGCGKSTVLRMVAGLESITSGEICIGGKPVNELPPKDRDIAMVFQNYALFPNLTVQENVTFGLKVRKASKVEIKKAMDKVAPMLGLTELLDRRPGELSGGQRQRVAVGRAIVRNPEVFLFDEPLSNLDAALRGQMRAEILRLHRQLEATMLYVTHDQIEAMSMADRIVVFNEGHIQQVGSPREIYEKPANRFVASFIGSPPMNFIEGRIDGEGGEARFVSSADDGVSLSLSGMKDGPDGKQDKVTLGIRPEDLLFPCPSGMPAIEAVVDIMEYFGSESSVTVRVGSDELVLLTKEEPAYGDKIKLGVDLSRAHIFSE